MSPPHGIHKGPEFGGHDPVGRVNLVELVLAWPHMHAHSPGRQLHVNPLTRKAQPTPLKGGVD